MERAVSDTRLLVHLEEAFGRIAYSCVDSSFELLRRAVSRVVNATELHSRFTIDALFADFVNSGLAHGFADAHILSFLGGTLGNYREDELMERLTHWMTPASHLLVDAWLWSANGWSGVGALSREEQQLLTGALSYPARNRFVFGPVEAATTATARDVTFEHETNRSITVVPGAVNIVTYCADLRARMRMTDEPVDRQRLSLAATTRYDFERLRDWFPTMGLHVSWDKNVGPVGVFLLRRK